MEGLSKKLVDLEVEGSKRPSLHLDILRQVLAGYENLPIMVVTIGGVARSGKSFLLNLIVNYLTYLEQNETDDGWEKQRSKVSGVNWAQSRVAVTLGMWIWSRPFVVTLSGNKKLCAEYADIESGGQENAKNLFQHLMFLVRNYNQSEEFGEAPELFSLIKQENQDANIARDVAGIEKAFRSVNSFTLPFPGSKIDMGSHDKHNLYVTDIPETFIQKVKEFCQLLFGVAKGKDRGYQQRLLTGTELIGAFERLKHRVESTDMVQISTPEEALQEAIIYRAFESANVIYRQAMEQLMNPDYSASLDTDEKLKAAYNAIELASNREFQEKGFHNKYSSTAIYKKYREMLDDCFKGGYERLRQEKRMQSLQQQSDKLEKRLEEKAAKLSNMESHINQMQLEQQEAKDFHEAQLQSFQTDMDRLKSEMEEASEEDRRKMQAKIDEHKREMDDIVKQKDEKDKIHQKQVEAMKDQMKQVEEQQKKQQAEAEQQMKAHEEEMNRIKALTQKQEEKTPWYKNAGTWAGIVSDLAGTAVNGVLGLKLLKR